MLLVRLVAAILTGVLVCGASCMPVHSGRPMGERPVDLSTSSVAWNGVWCTYAPPGTPLEKRQRECWVAYVADEANGHLVLNRLVQHESGEAPEAINVYVRASSEGFFLLSEEDAVLKGTFLWALACHYDSLLLVWTSDRKREAFVDLVATGELPGRIVEKLDGRSGLFDMTVGQTVILGDLKEKHLRLIVARRSELFDIVPTWILVRLPPKEPDEGE
jgi:hypothetical protein